MTRFSEVLITLPVVVLREHLQTPWSLGRANIVAGFVAVHRCSDAHRRLGGLIEDFEKPGLEE